MNTQLSLEVRVVINLANRAERETAETKIDTLIGNQNPGSYARLEYKENPDDLNTPYWLYARLFIVVNNFSELTTVRSTIITGIENNFTDAQVLTFEFDPLEEKA